MVVRQSTERLERFGPEGSDALVDHHWGCSEWTPGALEEDLYRNYVSGWLRSQRKSSFVAFTKARLGLIDLTSWNRPTPDRLRCDFGELTSSPPLRTGILERIIRPEVDASQGGLIAPSLHVQTRQALPQYCSLRSRPRWPYSHRTCTGSRLGSRATPDPQSRSTNNAAT